MKQPLTSGHVLDHEIVELPVDGLNVHPRNPNQGDLGAIMESVATNGFWGTVVVQKSTMRVLAGNHRMLAARELGIDRLPCMVVDVDDEQALRILVADNRTTRLGLDDQNLLAEILVELAMSEPTNLAGTGYDVDDLNALIADTGGETDAGSSSSGPKQQVVIDCETAAERDRIAADLEAQGYTVTRKGS